MAPEILAKKEYDEKVDVWALGVMIHLMLTSETPWTGSSPEELRMNIVRLDLNLAPFSVFH